MPTLTTFTVAEAKRDFNDGLLTDFGLERYGVPGGGWNVLLKGQYRCGALVDARTKQPRVFRTCDAAVSALEQIGFKVEGFTAGRPY